jgi:hypothetical protein
MGVFTSGAHRTLVNVMPGDDLPVQMLRLATTIAIALMVLVATAQVLRIPEYAEARDLVMNKLRRMAR